MNVTETVTGALLTATKVLVQRACIRSNHFSRAASSLAGGVKTSASPRRESEAAGGSWVVNAPKAFRAPPWLLARLTTRVLTEPAVAPGSTCQASRSPGVKEC